MEFAIADLFESVADHVPDHVAVVAGARRSTYRELDERTTRLARSLRDLGIGAGDHVAVHLPNCVEHVEALLAAWKARAVPINVNWRYVGDELAYVLRDARCVAAFTHGRFDGALDAIADEVPTLGHVIRVGAAPRHGERAGLDHETLVASGAATRDLGPRSGDDRYVLYTGGTTGMPKGVVWRQEDLFFAVLGGGNPGGPPIERPEQLAGAVTANPAGRAAAFLPPGAQPPPQLVQLALGPLMHASGQWSALGTLLGGGRVVLLDSPSLAMEIVLDLVERERVVALTLVGDVSARPLLQALAAWPGRWDTSSLVLLGSGGATLSDDTKRALFDALPSVAAITEAIGSSEAPAQAVALVTRDGAVPPTLRFVPKPETIVVDDDLQPVRPGSGTVGRLATRGRIPLGYLGDEARTAATFVTIDGQRWVLPGDMATVEDDGTVRVLGRGSMCINTGGEKVYPDEVEAALVAHPEVRDAVVVGVPDVTWGQRVVAVVAPADPARPPTLERLRRHCAPRLAGYKHPRAVVVVSDVVRGPAGKPDYAWALAVATASLSRHAG